LSKSIADKKALSALRKTAHTNTKTQRGNKFATLNAVLKKIASVSPGCEYFAVNYKLRVANRATELDGLKKGKAVLQGGKFAAGAAFLQKHA